MRFAVIANPRARRFRENPREIDALYKLTSGRGLLVTPETPDALLDDLRQIRDEAPPFLVIAGGDGTVSQVVTAILQVWDHAALPELCLVHGGTMNTISSSMGNKGEPAAQLEAFIKGDSFVRTRRWPLRVGFDRWGFLFGVGIVPRYIEAYDASGGGPKAAAATLAAKVASAVTGGEEAKAFFAPVRADLHVDGQLLPLKHWLILALGATHDLGLGFRPFPGLLDAPGSFGMYAAASAPWRFALDLPAFRLQRPVRHSLAFQQLCHEVRIVAPEPITYNLDGDVETGSTTLRIKPGPEIVFRLPPGCRPPRNTLGP